MCVMDKFKQLNLTSAQADNKYMYRQENFRHGHNEKPCMYLEKKRDFKKNVLT
ncbi:hypothetical protein HanHA300_Chr02g0038411 [Helianthus annuus]|nr:hypothetical protein HanHA300_Chr02g0038411 [Helianthus annuus]KAJ0617364.1 hypothetical protein HanHA89_Chr02g0041051 [Helianthus annuus]